MNYHHLPLIRLFVLTALFIVSCPFALCQEVPVENGNFNAGDSGAPAGWTLVQGQGQWLTTGGVDNSGAIVVNGNGEDMASWMSPPLPLESGRCYGVSFGVRRVESSGGSAITGSNFCNVDRRAPQEYEFVTNIIRVPDNLAPEERRLRFGQWHVNGGMAFDNVSVVTVQPVHARFGDIMLGAGESIHGNTYSCQAPAPQDGTNDCRTLAQLNAYFNSNRYLFSQGSSLVFRHSVAGRDLSGAKIRVNLNYMTNGVLAVSYSTDGEAWHELGQFIEQGSHEASLPDDLPPADTLWIRLAGAAAEGQQNGSFQLDNYTFESQIDGAPMDADGDTQYLEVLRQTTPLNVAIDDLGPLRPGEDASILATIENTGPKSVSIVARTKVDAKGEEEVSEVALDLAPGTQKVRIPYAVQQSGEHELSITVGDGYEGALSFHVPILYAADYGEQIFSVDDFSVWWASSGWKISKTRPVPEKKGKALRISLARNETEAAQFVIRTERPVVCGRFLVKGIPANAHGLVSGLVGPGGAMLPASAFEFLNVDYVDIVRPTDSTGVAAPWPDPLLPMVYTDPHDPGNFQLTPHENNVFWVRVTAPKDTPAGDYTGHIMLGVPNTSNFWIPIVVHVYDFTLPDRPTCQTAFGFSPGLVYKYQHLETDEQKRTVLDKYWADFSAHRISPYDPAPLDNFQVQWPDINKDAPPDPESISVNFDFTAYDAAMTRAIDEYHFNSFRLPIAGMGGGTFHSRVDPELLGFGADTPTYKALFKSYAHQLQEHLHEKGWLDEAYVYWFDEPDRKDYDFVNAGFARLKECAPDIRRMLTEQVEPGLTGGPTLWCPISNAFDGESAQPRQALGEEFWWYVCTGPKAPYTTLFIDHPGTELRVWLWQTWQRGIDGILVWQSNYWTSSAAYPDEPQNPYTDPMSWTSGYSTAAGNRLPWGNGDGRFIYPPKAAADAQSPEPVMEGPVDSIRWEMLRDGIEDYEYLTILANEIEAQRTSLTDPEIKAYEELLSVPEAITKDMTTFTTDPGIIEEHRARIAEAIESLGN